MQQLQVITDKWINDYAEEKTRKAAITAHNRLFRYLGDEDLDIQAWIDSMKTDNDAKYHAVKDYLSQLNLMPATVKQYYAFTKAYLRLVHRIKLDPVDAKDIIKLSKIAKVERLPMSKDMIKMLCHGSNDYYKVLFLLLSSSGMRISELLSCKYSNFNFKKDPVSVSLGAEITKTDAERITFVSNEAVTQLEKLGKDFFESHSLNTVEQYFWKLRNKLNLTERYNNSPNFKTNIHSFRSFFRTQAGKINRDFAEAVLGHEGYLKQYVRLEYDEKADYYKKTEPNLKIF